MAELDGKVVLVTGGSRGMGRAAAEMFAAAGASVVICARTKPDVDRAVSEISARHDAAVIGIEADVLDTASVDALMAEIDAHFGRLDMLINNAGQSSQRAAKGATFQVQVSHPPDDPELPPGRFDSMTDDEFRNAFVQKALGMIRVTRGALPLLRKGTAAAIVNVVSTKGLQSPVRVVTSGVAWAAALNFSKCLSYELVPDGIRVNVLGVDVADREIARPLGRRHDHGAVRAMALRRRADPAHGHGRRNGRGHLLSGDAALLLHHRPVSRHRRRRDPVAVTASPLNRRPAFGAENSAD